MQEHARTAWHPLALHRLDARTDRRRDDDCEEEERHDQAPDPNDGDEREYPKHDQCGQRDSAREIAV